MTPDRFDHGWLRRLPCWHCININCLLRLSRDCWCVLMDDNVRRVAMNRDDFILIVQYSHVPFTPCVGLLLLVFLYVILFSQM